MQQSVAQSDATTGGEQGVSFYQGSSSLHGLMHAQCIENVANNRDRPPISGVLLRDEDMMWG